MSQHIMKEVLFISGEPFTAEVSIPIAQRHLRLIANDNTSLSLRAFHNGEQVRTMPSRDVQRPIITLISKGTAISVILRLPRPTPNDEGVYEMQLFVDITMLSPRDCPDYVDFVRSPDGLKLSNILISSTTLMVLQQGKHTMWE